MISKRHSFWWDGTAPDFCYSSQLPSYVDTVIIGAGAAGLSTAYWLARYIKKAKKTHKILVIEEAGYPAFKGTGRIGGSVYLGSNKTPTTLIKAMGEQAAMQLYRYSAANNALLFSLLANNLNCALESNGGLRMATNAKEAVDLDDSNEFLHKLGNISVRFDNQQTQHIAIAPHVNGTLYVPLEGMLDPFAFSNNLARLLRTVGGLSIAYGTYVDMTMCDKDGPVVMLSNGHTIHAGSIVHATTKSCPSTEVLKQIVYKREHVVRTNPFGEDLDDMALPMMPIELGSSSDSIRMYGRSLLMTGGKSGLKKDVEHGVLDDSDFNKRIFEHLNETMLRHFPFTNLVDLTHVWTYIEASTKDHIPLMGEFKSHPGHYINAAHGRNKFGLAFLGAKNIAESILKMDMNNVEFSLFSPNRFTREDNVQTV